MATQDQLVDIPLVGGLEEGTDAANVKPPGFLVLENAIFDKKGGIQKRKGAGIAGTLGLIKDATARWISHLDGNTLVGTSEGVYHIPEGSSARTWSRGSLYDATVDHTILAGIPNNIIEIDSAVISGYLFVAFTVDTTFTRGTSSGNELYYAVYNLTTGELLRTPTLIRQVSGITRPLITYTSTHVSFWRIESGTGYYTSGIVLSTLVSATAVPSFSHLSSGTSTLDICWEKGSVATDGVTVFSLTTSTVRTYRSASASLSSFPPGTVWTPAFYTGFLKVECVRESVSSAIYVCAYEGTATGNYGKLIVSYFLPGSNAWAGLEVNSYLTASPVDGSYSVTAGTYVPAQSRLTMGFLENGATLELAVWGSCLYTFPLRGSGTCTTLLTTPLTLLSTFTRVKDMFTYALVSHAFPVTGKRNWCAGIARTGVVTHLQEDFPTYTFNEVDMSGFTAMIIMSPSEASKFTVTPIATAFDLRMPTPYYGSLDASFNVSEGLSITIIPKYVKYSLARGHVIAGTDKVLIASRTQPTPLSTAVQTLQLDYNFEVALLDFKPLAPPKRQTANGVNLGRGLCGYFDGSSGCENAPIDIPFISPPDTPPQEPGSTAYPYAYFGGGNLPQVVYVWEDGKGNLHRSAPSLKNVLGWTEPPSQNEPTDLLVLDFPVSMVTEPLQLQLTPRYVELYLENPTSGISVLFGRVPYTRGVRVPNWPHVRRYTLSWFDIIQGYDPITGISTLDVRAPLYTTGDVLENQCPPTFKDTCVAKGRFWGLTDDRVFYSKPLEHGIAPEFNYALTLKIPGNAGRTTAIAGMDDKVIVFTERGVFTVYGDGPNALGSGGSFAELLPIPGNIGCLTHGSVVEIPKGLAFLSDQGFYLLDRGLNLAFIGEGVESTVSQFLTSTSFPVKAFSCVHDIQGRHVRWVMPSGPNLVWYYDTNQWGTFTRFAETQLIYFAGVTQALVVNGVNAYVYKENNTDAQYALINFLLRVRTGWIPLSGIEGYQRVKRFNFLFNPAKVPSSVEKQGLQVNLYTDYDPTANTTHTWTQAEMTALPDNRATELSVQPAVQKCAAMSVEFVETLANVNGDKVGIGTTISGITMRVGTKKGPKKTLADARRK